MSAGGRPPTSIAVSLMQTSAALSLSMPSRSVSSERVVGTHRGQKVTHSQKWCRGKPTPLDLGEHRALAKPDRAPDDMNPPKRERLLLRRTGFHDHLAACILIGWRKA
jgi:hypothetical protein